MPSNHSDEEEKIKGYDASEHVKFYASFKWGQLNTYIGITFIVAGAISALILQLDEWETSIFFLTSLSAALIMAFLGPLALGIKWIEFHLSFLNSKDNLELFRKEDMSVSRAGELRRDIIGRRDRILPISDRIIYLYGAYTFSYVVVVLGAAVGFICHLWT